jgi:signal transduction histidine kinase
LLTLIIRNLIANAIRYTDRGTVKVSCRREADGLRITIEDSGIGIAPDQLTSIFDEFYRVETGSANRSGNFGLGLAIVERSATLLGTTLQVESAVGRGSTFSFLVPRVDAAGVELTVAG